MSFEHRVAAAIAGLGAVFSVWTIVFVGTQNARIISPPTRA